MKKRHLAGMLGALAMVFFATQCRVQEQPEQQRNEISAMGSSVPTDAADVCPLKVGQEVPDLVYERPDGTAFSLAGALEEKPALLIVYRGGW